MKISMIKTATVWDFPGFSTLNMPGFYNGITTAQIDTLAAETCAYMSQKHPDFSTLAARIAVSNLHKTHGKRGRGRWCNGTWLLMFFFCLDFYC